MGLLRRDAGCEHEMSVAAVTDVPLLGVQMTAGDAGVRP
jgi:hypothetical protein